MKSDPTQIVAAATDMVHAAITVGVCVLVGGLAVVAVWGWLTRGRGY